MADQAVRIALLSASDTDLLSARASGMAYIWSNPSRASDAELRAATDGASWVMDVSLLRREQG